jgi:hypothetical protein
MSMCSLLSRDSAMALILPFRARKKLASGKIQMTANDFPAFLWSGNPPGDEYDGDAMTQGLFRGYLLERVSHSLFTAHRVSHQPLAQVMRHIFTGPSTALGDDSRATRSCNAALHDMVSVEAEHIAYGCVQVSSFLIA